LSGRGARGEEARQISQRQNEVSVFFLNSKRRRGVMQTC
jgi:hypothetical protein